MDCDAPCGWERSHPLSLPETGSELALSASALFSRLIMAARRREGAPPPALRPSCRGRLADEYDAAQERGEVGQLTGHPSKVVPNKNDIPATAAAEAKVEAGADQRTAAG